MMKLYKFSYICKRCANRFDDYELGGDFIYGEFILRSEGLDSKRYLNALDDPVFNELSQIIKNSNSLNNKNDRQKAELLHQIFGITCDPDIDGTLFQMNLNPKCPKCGGREMDSWGEVFPLYVNDFNIHHVTHQKWNLLSVDEKCTLLNKLLEKLGFNKNIF